MSLSSMHARLQCPDSSLLLPSNLPIDELIFLTRKIALCLDGGMDLPERSELKMFLTDYLGLLVRMQSVKNYSQFLTQVDTMVPELMITLDLALRDELVSRLIGCSIHRSSLPIAINGYFDEINVSAETSNAPSESEKRTHDDAGLDT